MRHPDYFFETMDDVINVVEVATGEVLDTFPGNRIELRDDCSMLVTGAGIAEVYTADLDSSWQLFARYGFTVEHPDGDVVAVTSENGESRSLISLAAKSFDDIRWR